MRADAYSSDPSSFVFRRSLRTEIIPLRTILVSPMVSHVVVCVGPTADAQHVITSCCLYRTDVTKVLPFTSSIPSVKEFLGSLYASGGGDGPEAVTAGMSVALDGVEWRQDAAKMVVLVADAPPHGIGEYGDGFPNGSPDGELILNIVWPCSCPGIMLTD